ncbi:MAG: NADPH dehydrogenase, partial [Alphaproteobacteria bacterium]
MPDRRHENHREDVAGRANVADTPELVAYYDDLARSEAGALWTVANRIEPWEPRSASVPMLWRYADLRGPVLRSLALVEPEKAGRRVIYLANPGRRGGVRGGVHRPRPARLSTRGDRGGA